LKQIFTAGHSNRPLEEFLDLLEGAGIELLADVRAYPASRRHPHFGREPLSTALQGRGIGYLWLGRELGGHRTARPDSANTGLAPVWRGYADQMQTAGFARGIAELQVRAGTLRTVVMCAERNPDDCHRNLIADQLTALEWCVTHIIGANEQRLHSLHAAARVTEAGLSYPGTDQQQLGLGF